MGIIIHGMSMPEHCGKCKLKIVYDDETFCPFFTDNVEYWIAAGRRHEDCSFGPVPPHGRLIDADELWMDIIHAMDYCEDILEFIEAAPTVIPADNAPAPDEPRPIDGHREIRGTLDAQTGVLTVIPEEEGKT